MYFKRGVSLSFFVLLPDFYGNENNKKIIFCFFYKKVLTKGKRSAIITKSSKDGGTLRTE